jgi:nitroimidazol reductase NimA-like FMN-containing flavoprotein (pyridoxamine 5'-phosphate oxidase superfamily)
VKIAPDAPWNRAQVDRYLRETVAPIRLACIAGQGWPLVLSLWFEYDGGVLWCATHSRSHVASHLKHDGRVAFEVSPNEPPYRGVRGRGRATLEAERGDTVLRRLLRRYLGGEDSDLARWLLSRSHEELAVRIEPSSMQSWDYTRRMAARVKRSDAPVEPTA